MRAPSDIGDFVIGQSPIGGTGTLTEIIPSYLYTQYNDDPGLQALVAAFNQYAQSYLDWFNDIQLPIYTRVEIFGVLLDWVAEGLYGLTRPTLPAGRTQIYGPFNTYTFNSQTFNHYKRVGPAVYYATSDDIFKRIITWVFFKGDGFQFNVRWLKRRIQRFLTGANGTAPPVDQTYQISVVFAGSAVTIRILSRVRVITGGALFNRFAFNTTRFNAWRSTVVQLPPVPLAPIFKAAVDAGVLPLPFQFTYNVQI